MVAKSIRVTLLFLFFAFPSLFAVWGTGESLMPAAEVTASIDPYQTVADQPIPGTVTVTHDNSQTVDEGSFQMGGKPLKVNHVKTVNINPSQTVVLSIYSFQLPGQSAGLYILPTISVKVGGKTYQTIPSSYEISQAQQMSQESSSGVTLSLKALIDGPPTVYPGQRIWFIYRFYFSGSIDLTDEKLPLLEAQGFQLVGDKRIRNYQEDNIEVQEISQQVQAIKPGKYSFPASSAEGYAYRDDIIKKRVYLAPKLKAEAPALDVTVTSFPAAGKPSAFRGAVGQFTIQTSLLTPAEVGVDEKMLLAIDINGLGEISTIGIPDLSSIKNSFRMSSLPPEVKTQDGQKRFVVEIYPLATSIKEIPPIPFAFFNPLIGDYVTENSAAIPIQVKATQVPKKEEAAPATPPPATPLPTPPSPRPQEVPSIAPSGPLEVEEKIQKPAAIEIAGNLELTDADLHNLWFGTWSTLYIVPFAFIFILAQKGYKRYREKFPTKEVVKTSQSMLDAAMRTKDPSVFSKRISQALLLRLFELGYTTSEEITFEELPEAGVTGEVRELLSEIEAGRFGKQTLSLQQLKAKAKELFDRLIPSETTSNKGISNDQS